MNNLSNWTLTSCLVLSAVVISPVSQARLSEFQYVSKCMELSSASKRSGPNFTCAAASSKDSELLSSAGISDSFEISTEDANVGSWGDGANNYYGEVSYVVKRTLLSRKVMRINCSENRLGKVEYSPAYNSIFVQVENRIDSSVNAKVICK